MKRILIFIGALLAAGICAAQAPAPTPGKPFSGAAALEFTAKVTAFGPHPSGSAAISRVQAWIKAQLAEDGCQISSDPFTAQTPDGPVAMENIIARFPGKSGHGIAITGHYDTKKMPGFVGANDGGSSTGTLLELAAALKGKAHADDIYVVFFDGEEALHEWTDTDSVYGSRHLAKKWAADGTNNKLKALINVDMTGDRNLDLVYDANSATSLRDLVWSTAAALGYSVEFQRQRSQMEDDHLPFLNAGVRAVDLIDFDYGPNNAYWHSTQDTMDKLSAHSFEVIGTVLMRVIPELEAEK